MNKKNLLSLTLLLSAISLQSAYSMEQQDSSPFNIYGEVVSDSDYARPSKTRRFQFEDDSSMPKPVEKLINAFSSHESFLIFIDAEAWIKNPLVQYIIAPLLHIDGAVLKEVSAELMSNAPGFKDEKTKEAAIKDTAKEFAGALMDYGLKIGDGSPKAIAARFVDIKDQEAASNEYMRLHFVTNPVLRSKDIQKLLHYKFLSQLDTKVLDLLQEVLTATEKELETLKADLEKRVKTNISTFDTEKINKKLKAYPHLKALLKDVNGYVWRARHPWIAHVQLLSRSQQLLLGAIATVGAVCAYKYMTAKNAPVIDSTDDELEDDADYIYAA